MVQAKAFAAMNDAERATLEKETRGRYEEARELSLTLDMTRGKPSPEQLDLADGLVESVTSKTVYSDDGTDGRNYGGVDGLKEAKALFADLLGVPVGNVVIGGNSSLQLMHDLVVQAMVIGVPGGAGSWRSSVPSEKPIRFVCPVPGYDRHFKVLARYGIEMITVPMTPSGPEMDQVEELVGSDPTIKGMFNVPRYSNPTGVTYSDRTVERLASMKSAAPDFRLFWDDAYAFHHLYGSVEPLADVLELGAAAGEPDRAFVFASTSKISHAGAGLSFVVGSDANIAFVREARGIQTIGPDKLNQLRHIRFFGNPEGVIAHMSRHAAILRPKFEAVLEILESRLGGLGLAEWTRPKGGYFISVDVLDGCARRVVELASEAGVKLTPAGATFPHGEDPRDRNLRLAPSLPSPDELRIATELMADCVVLAALEAGEQQAEDSA